MFLDYVKLDKGKYNATSDFEFHIPKKGVSNIESEPNVMLFGKVYTSDGKCFDVTQCTSSLSEPSTYKELKDRYVLIYKDGDLFCNEQMVRSISNIELLFKLLIGGQILSDFEYQSIFDSFLNAMDNNVKLSVPRNFFEYIISIFVRQKDDISKQFRFASSNDIDLKSISLVNALMTASTFSSMTSRDPLTMLITTVGKDGTEESALEKTFRK